MRPKLIRSVVEKHILPSTKALAETSATLAASAQDNCEPQDSALRLAYGRAFDAWIAVSHLHFGPFETDNRGFALAFWPDTRSKTPKTLGAMIRNADQVAGDATAYAAVSIAARGFYALEFLLYDAPLSRIGSTAYRCQLLRRVTADISLTATAISTDWQQLYAPLLLRAGTVGNVTYQTTEEAVQELFKAMMTGLQFTTQARLGRPMGTPQRPRPKRAEARRSGRSMRHVQLSLTALADLAMLLSAGNPPIQTNLAIRFKHTQKLAAQLNDPIFATVATPQGRIRFEVLKQSIEIITLMCIKELAPKLGVVGGFNALDGD